MAALAGELRREIVRLGGLQRLGRLVGIAGQHVDQGQLRPDPRLVGALEAEPHLGLQQPGGAVEKIDTDQPVGQLADHLVPPGAGGGEFLELVIEGDRRHRRQFVRPSLQVEVDEGVGHFLGHLGRQFVLAEMGGRLPQRPQAAAVIAFVHVEPAEPAQQREFEFVSAPRKTQFLQFFDGFRAGDLAQLQEQFGARHRGLGPARPVGAAFGLLPPGDGAVEIPSELRQPPLDQGQAAFLGRVRAVELERLHVADRLHGVAGRDRRLGDKHAHGHAERPRIGAGDAAGARQVRSRLGHVPFGGAHGGPPERGFVVVVQGGVVQVLPGFGKVVGEETVGPP